MYLVNEQIWSPYDINFTLKFQPEKLPESIIFAKSSLKELHYFFQFCTKLSIRIFLLVWGLSNVSITPELFHAFFLIDTFFAANVTFYNFDQREFILPLPVKKKILDILFKDLIQDQ